MICRVIECEEIAEWEATLVGRSDPGFARLLPPTMQFCDIHFREHMMLRRERGALMAVTMLPGPHDWTKAAETRSAAIQALRNEIKGYADLEAHHRKLLHAMQEKIIALTGEPYKP